MMDTAEQAVNFSAMQYWKKVESQRVKLSQKIYFWYYNYQDEIVQYIKDSMLKGWKPETIKETRIRVLNIVPRVIDKLALVYKETPERTLDGGKKAEANNAGEVIEKQSPNDVKYQAMLEKSSIAKKSGEWEKLSRAFNTVLVQPVWREDGGYIDFMIHTPAFCSVQEVDGDFTKPKAFWYPIWKSKSLNAPQEQQLVYWDNTKHYLIDATGNNMAPDNNAGMVNPYGILPVAVLRRKLSNDFWGEGMWDLVDGNEEVCIQITNLFKVAAFQLHGQPFGINLNLGGEPKLGPDRPIVANGVESGSVQPDFRFVTASPLLKPVMDLVDWALKNIQMAKGLGANQVDMEQSVASGVSKIVDSTDIQESRKDDIRILQEFESDLFTVTRAVYNYHATDKIDEKAVFAVNFLEPKVTETTDEKNKKREAGLKNGTMSRIDIIMSDNSCTREEAKTKLRQIIAENKEFDDKYGLNDGAMDEGDDTSPDDPDEPIDDNDLKSK